MSLNLQVAGYAHSGESDTFTAYSNYSQCFCVFEADGAHAQREAFDAMVRECNERTFEHLKDFEAYVLDALHAMNVPFTSSLACVYIAGSKAFIKTVGTGTVYLRRGAKTARLVRGNSSASGIVREGDCVVATTQSLIDITGGEESFLRSYLRDDVQKNVHALSEISRKQQRPFVACYAQLTQQTIAVQPAVVQSDMIESEIASESGHPDDSRTEEIQKSTETTKSAPEPSRLAPIIEAMKEAWHQKRSTMTRQKTITLAVVLLIFFIFVWSVGLGIYRHQRKQVDEKIQTTQELVTQKLRQAEEVSILNSARAQALLADARADLSALKKGIKEDKNPRIAQMEQLIQQMEGRILRREEKEFTEYYDLTVDRKGAKGDRMAYSEGSVAILDTSGSIVYILSLEKKSLLKFSAPQAATASDVALYRDAAYVVKSGDGIYKLLENGKSVRVIPQDAAWGGMTDTELFNGNMYVLDGVRNNIYKFIVATDNVFASAGGYFKGTQPRAVSSPVSMAIDGSIYIISRTAAAKYTSGLRDGFAPQFPSESISLRKVLTQDEEGKIYIWDKDNGSVYIVNKEGGYERQVQSSVFKTGSDMAVHERAAYVLQGAKLYRVDMN